jgi:hypothetical protein
VRCRSSAGARRPAGAPDQAGRIANLRTRGAAPAAPAAVLLGWDDPLRRTHRARSVPGPGPALVTLSCAQMLADAGRKRESGRS